MQPPVFTNEDNPPPDLGYGRCNQTSPQDNAYAWGPYLLSCRASKADCVTTDGTKSSLNEVYCDTQEDPAVRADCNVDDWSALFGCTNGGHCCDLKTICYHGGLPTEAYADICPQVKAYWEAF